LSNRSIEQIKGLNQISQEEKMEMMAKSKYIRYRKEHIFNDLFPAQICICVPMWQKKINLTIFLSIVFLLTISAQSGDTEWPLFRGNADLSGKVESELPSTPTLLWSVNTGGRTKSSPVISAGRVYFGNDKGSLIAVSAEGKIMWKYESGSSLDAPPMIYGKKVIFGSSEGILTAVDKITGKLLWSYTTDNQIAGSANGWKSGNKAGIVVGSYDFYLHCVDPETGKSLWKVETENYINGTPSILNGKIAFGGCDGMFRVVDPLTGKQKDTINIGVYIASSPALSDNMAYFGDYDGNIYCLDLNLRKVCWKVSAGKDAGSILAIPAIRNNSIVIGSEDKYLYCYTAYDGKLLWKYRANSRINGSAVITSTKVLFAGMDGIICILRLADGKKLWSFNAGTPVSSSPAVINGKFFILTEDGRLLSFGEKTISR
jgi:eukaryotic-like serine/threonine-protein kinase